LRFSAEGMDRRRTDELRTKRGARAVRILAGGVAPAPRPPVASIPQPSPEDHGQPVLVHLWPAGRRLTKNGPAEVRPATVVMISRQAGATRHLFV
jgi:hypothetical protein